MKPARNPAKPVAALPASNAQRALCCAAAPSAGPRALSMWMMQGSGQGPPRLSSPSERLLRAALSLASWARMPSASATSPTCTAGRGEARPWQPQVEALSFRLLHSSCLPASWARRNLLPAQLGKQTFPSHAERDLDNIVRRPARPAPTPFSLGGRKLKKRGAAPPRGWPPPPAPAPPSPSQSPAAQRWED